jgi:hypothetical protein
VSIKNTKQWIPIACVATLLAAGGVWGWTHYAAKAPSDDELSQLRAQATADPNALFGKMRDTMRDEKLTDDQRRKMMDNMRTVFEEQMDKRVDEYYTAKPEDREEILDRHIDEFEKFRREREKEREEAEAKGEDREKDREQWRKRMSERSRAERKADSEKRDINKMARRMAYFNAVRQQMQKRGIEPPRWGGPGGPGGRGGPGGPRRG